MFLKRVSEFFDRLAPEWDGMGSQDNTKIGLILNYAGIIAGCRVLDVACGTGVLFPYYLERNVRSVTGIDLSAGMIARAKEKFDDPRISLIVGDAEKLRANDFDCCVIFNALPHFEDPGRLFASMADRLASNGRITVAHSENRETINRRHEGGARAISFHLPPASELAPLLSPFFLVDTVIDDNELYVVSGIKK